MKLVARLAASAVLFAALFVAPTAGATEVLYYKPGGGACSISVPTPYYWTDGTGTSSNAWVRCDANTYVKIQNHFQRWDGYSWSTIVVGTPSQGWSNHSSVQSSVSTSPRTCGIIRAAAVVIMDGVRRDIYSSNIKVCNA
jgi:hypothetical protein